MFQTAINLTDTPKKEYNGWSDWTTWNCALWIGGDEGFYNLARYYRNYGEFVDCINPFEIEILYLFFIFEFLIKFKVFNDIELIH